MSRTKLNKSYFSEIGRRIKELRKGLKLTQGQFARRIRRDTSTISKIEGGGIDLTRLMSLAICNVFGVREEWLLTGKEPKFDDRKKLLEDRARELGEDIFLWFKRLKVDHELRQESTDAILKGKLKILGYEELSDPKLFALLRKFIRIYNDRDPKKLAAIESLFDLLDPGEKKSGVDPSEDAEVGSEGNVA